MELKTAIEQSRPVFIFVEKGVRFEYGTWQLNRDNDAMKFRYVDNKRIFEFLSEIEALPKNNPTFEFETASDITALLRAQWAGLFQRMMAERARIEEANTLKSINETAKTLGSIVEYLREERTQGDEAIKSIIMFNHPAFAAIKAEMEVPYRVTFLDKKELATLARQRRFDPIAQNELDDPNFDEFLARDKSYPKKLVHIFKEIFDADGRLKPYSSSDWNAKWVFSTEVEDPEAPSSTDPDDDLPF
jgi:hypothetical protein